MQAFDLEEMTQKIHATLGDAWHLGCTGRSVEAITLASDALAQAQSAGLERLAAQCDTDIAWFYFQIGKAEAGLTHVRPAIAFWKAAGEHALEAYARAYYGWLLLEVGLPEEAADEATRALHLADLSADPRAQSLAANVMGIIFWYNKQPDRAILMSEKSVEIARAIGDRTYECWWLINLGGACSEAGYLAKARNQPDAMHRQLTRAVELTVQALDIAIEAGDSWAARICLANNTEYYCNLGEHDKAIASIGQYNHHNREMYVRDRQHYLYTLANIYNNYGNFEESLPLLLEAADMIAEGGSFDSSIQIYLHLSKTYEGLGDFRQALEMHKKYHQAYLQNSAEETQKHARLAEIHYETKRFRDAAETLESSYQALRLEADALADDVYLDGLTGIYNRRYFDIRLGELLHDRRSHSVAILDIDHFKTVNDTFSHMIGDQVLKTMGSILRQNLRVTDQAFRYGGEEFVVLLTGDLQESSPVCERLRAVVEDRDWSEICDGLHITVSIGVSDSVSGHDPDAILKIADRNLYAAKRNGRNRVVSGL
jgi:two-component system, cell cycle response regulator